MVLAQVRKAQPPSLVDSIGSPLQEDAASHAPFGVTGCYVINRSNDLPWCPVALHAPLCFISSAPQRGPTSVMIVMRLGRLFLRVDSSATAACVIIIFFLPFFPARRR